MRIRRIVSAIAASAAAVAVSFSAAGPAHAADHHWMYTEDGDAGGRVDFWPVGDKVRLCDVQADGKGVRLQVWDHTQNFLKYTIRASAKGDCTEVNANTSTYNLRENNDFRFRICLTDGGVAMEWTCDSAYWTNHQ